jgi:hypothetical protein
MKPERRPRVLAGVRPFTILDFVDFRPALGSTWTALWSLPLR